MQDRPNQPLCKVRNLGHDGQNNQETLTMQPVVATRLLATFVVLLCALSGIAHAVTLTWDTDPGTVGDGNDTIEGGPGTWNTSNGNWTSDGGVNNVAWNNATPDAAIFAGAAGGLVTLGENINATSLTFNTAGYTIGTASGTNTITMSGSKTITLNADAQLNSRVLWSGQLELDLNGNTLTKAGVNANAFQGSLLVNDGTLRLNASGNFGAFGATSLIVGNGADFTTVRYLNQNQIGDSSPYVPVTIRKNGTLDLNNFSLQTGGRALSITFEGGGSLVGGGPNGISQDRIGITYTAVSGGVKALSTATHIGIGRLSDGSITVGDDPNLAVELEITGIISTGGASDQINKRGSGTLLLSGNNTYTGATTVIAGTLLLGGNAPNGGVGVTGTLGNATSAVLVGHTSGTDSAALLIGGAYSVGRPVTVQSGNSGTISLGGNSAHASSFTNTVTLNKNATLTAAGGGTVTFSGGIGGTGAVTKAGDGTVVLTGANSYGGGTTISAGTLQLGNGTTNGSVAGDITNNAALVFNNGLAQTFAGAINGTGSLVKTGAGTLELSGANGYTGATTVSQGRLLVTGSTAVGSAVNVAPGATLGGTGTIGGPTSIAGLHAPGSSPGIQTFGSDLEYTAGATVEWELVGNTTTNAANPNAVFDTIVVEGDLDFAGTTTLSLVFDGAGSAVLWSNSLWNAPVLGIAGWLLYDVTGSTTNAANLVLAAGAWLDSNGDALAALQPKGEFLLFQDGSDIYLNYNLIPEPASLGLLALGGLALLRRQRRHQGEVAGSSVIVTTQPRHPGAGKQHEETWFAATRLPPVGSHSPRREKTRPPTGNMPERA